MKSYGEINHRDVTVLEEEIERLLRNHNFPLRVLEIGVREGHTGAGIKRFCASKDRNVQYVGVDPDHSAGRADVSLKVLHKESQEAFDEVRKIQRLFDLIIVDGCHCRSHVILDVVMYSHLLDLGGTMLLHDVNPHLQGLNNMYQGHGDPDHHANAECVLEAVELLKLRTHDFNGLRWKREEVTKSAPGGFIVLWKD